MKLPILTILCLCALPFCHGATAPDTTPAVSLQQVKDALEKMPKLHPRLLSGPNEQKSLAEGSKRPDGKKLTEKIIHDAQLLLKEAPVERRFNGKRMLEASRKVLQRITILGMAWRLSGEPRFAERGIAELLNAAAYPDWNPKHFLDVGEMTLALALGYDWFYSEMTPEQRQKVADAILNKGIREGLKVKHGWATGNNNWTQVCHAGMVAGALAVYEDAPEAAEQSIYRAIQNLPRAMRESYAPNGAFPEGPGYWVYGTEFNAVLLGLLNSALGQDFELSKSSGFDRTGEYITAMVGPSGLTCNFSDCSTNSIINFAKLWWIARFKRPDCFSVADRHAFDRYTNAKSARPDSSVYRLMPLALLYLSGLPAGGSADQPLSYFSGFGSAIPLAMHRSSNTPDATYVVLKGGVPFTSHGHMDSGAFILESDGVRWAIDPGVEDYTKFEKAGVKLWNLNQQSDRWKILRLGPKLHNILLIDGHPQNVKGLTVIREHRGAGAGQYTVLDLTPAYEADASSVVRKVQLADTGVLRITDTLTGLKPGSQVRWQMCTQAAVREKTAGRLLLSRDGKTMTVSATSTSPVAWRTLETSELEGLLDRKNDARMVFFDTTAPQDGQMTLEVSFTPGSH